MKITIFFILLSLIALRLGIYFTVKQRNISPKEFVDKIDSLGYFKYAEANYRDSLKMNFINNFDPDNELVTLWDEQTYTPLDYRYYMCDGETVYEEGGITEMLEDMKPTFEKIGFKLSIDDHIEEWDSENQWLNHRITLNGTEYTIFKNFRGYGWGEAVQRLAEILNDELEKQQIDENIYLVNGANDGRLVFLSEKLYQYIYSIYHNPQWKPLEVTEWTKVMKVKPMNLD